ncbi:uncharacterized protein LOC143922382 [Arctopsyche grandis]|uniref:uncharacterized protein LOC143922382 n=1 Tax=Arctopsyche grandis TaxID=121162 RepID=UPI00406D85D7
MPTVSISKFPIRIYVTTTTICLLDVVEAVQQHAAFLYERGGKMTSMIKKIYIQCIGRIGGAKIKFIENPFTVIITTPLMKRDQTIITLYLLTQRHPVICNNTL